MINMSKELMAEVQKIKSNPFQYLASRGFNIPQNMNDPTQMMQHLLNSQQVTQQRYNDIMRMK